MQFIILRKKVGEKVISITLWLNYIPQMGVKRNNKSACALPSSLLVHDPIWSCV